MASPTRLNLKFYQGSTFNETIRWESSIKKYTQITAMFKTAPLVVTASNHAMPAGWRAIISNVLGMTEANSLGYIVGTSVTTNNITFNEVNAAGFKDYISGGTLEYNEPMSLADYTARMQIREKLTSTSTIAELTTENTKININDTTKTISINITAEETALYTFKTAVYSLELVKGEVITPLIYGTITLDKEITR